MQFFPTKSSKNQYDPIVDLTTGPADFWKLQEHPIKSNTLESLDYFVVSTRQLPSMRQYVGPNGGPSRFGDENVMQAEDIDGTNNILRKIPEKLVVQTPLPVHGIFKI